jgi:hypothetical protein
VLAEEIEAPASWSDAAVVTVASRYLGQRPDGSRERSVRSLVECVVRTIGGWAQDGGQAASAAERALLEAELAALVLTQRPEVSPQAIESIFLDAWQMGLKSISVYRLGSKVSQPLQAADD